MEPPPSPAFELRNPDTTGPVLVSVPHAGRSYPSGMRALLRPPAEKLMGLEDRLVDMLLGELAGAPALIARAPRSWIDLNRHEAEIDPGLVDGVVPSRLMLTPKVRSGLGLIPRRLAGIGDVWRGRLRIADVEERIARHHRPYHRALNSLIERALETHGIAIVIDLHSMPPLPEPNGAAAPRIVIGNRFGHTAGPWVTSRVAATCSRFGLSWRENSPYAGGHIVERHGAPARGVHAIQLEIDRSLYLDDALEACDPEGLGQSRALFAALIEDLSAAARDTFLPFAAE
jgi:N-formylglutamate amidohydrolase